MIISDKVWISSILEKFWKNILEIIATSIISYLCYKYFLKGNFEMSAIIPSVLGTALAFFIGFNNNQAYDRWWEARKIWGALVNDSRTWARQIMSYTNGSNKYDLEYLTNSRKIMIHRHIAFLYALKDNLRNTNHKEYKKYISSTEFDTIETHANKHNAILNFQSEDLENMHSNGIIDGFRFIELNKSLIAFTNEMGKSERIKNTVFPSTYHLYTRIFIYVLIISVTIETATYAGLWSIFVGALIGTIYIIIQKIGLALLNPFEELKTGIPLDQITRTIEINLLETLGESEIPEPIKSVNNKYIM